MFGTFGYDVLLHGVLTSKAFIKWVTPPFFFLCLTRSTLTRRGKASTLFIHWGRKRVGETALLAGTNQFVQHHQPSIKLLPSASHQANFKTNTLPLHVRIKIYHELQPVGAHLIHG